ncbi:unnamed protein product [Caenorhabditis nigoni]
MNNELNEKLITLINAIAKNVFMFQFVVSTIGLVMNLPHLLILLHKSMRTSSTNSIMIGIAICDLIVFFGPFSKEHLSGLAFTRLVIMKMSGTTCTGYPANYSEPTFLRHFEDYMNLFKIVHRYQQINGVSKILVSVSYPILTILLIFEIRKAAKLAKALNSRSSEERYRTCRMILVMTIFYVITSAPAGISEYVELFIKINLTQFWRFS